VAKEDAEYLGKREDHLPVRKQEQQPLVHVLAKEDGALLGAGGAQVEHLATERAEVVGFTFRIGALNATDYRGRESSRCPSYSPRSPGSARRLS